MVIGSLGSIDVLTETVGREEQAAGQQRQEDENSNCARSVIEIGLTYLVCRPPRPMQSFNATSDMVYLPQMRISGGRNAAFVTVT